MSKATDVTAVLTVHAEGVLAGPSFVSFDQAIEAARQSGLMVEGLIVMDRPDAATREEFSGVASRYRVLLSDAGDPGLARNAGVEAASGRFVSFLDGDDLWSREWLVLAHRLCAAEPDGIVAHSEVNVVFGEAHAMWWHIDSRDPDFDVDYLRIGNYWDAMSFAARAIHRQYPYMANDLRRGFGHEDWHWNCVTLENGIDHRPVAGTVHFKRRRRGSQMALCETVSAIPWITAITSYAWTNKTAVSGREGEG